MKAKEGIVKTSYKEKQIDVKKENKSGNKTPISMYVDSVDGGNVILRYLFPLRGQLRNITFIVNQSSSAKFSVRVETKKDDVTNSTITGTFSCVKGKNTIDKVDVNEGDVITLFLLGSVDVNIKDIWFSAIYKHH